MGCSCTPVEVYVTLQRLLFLLPVLVGMSFAQDTNFPIGPQYLVTSGNPLFLQPIATPSLSLSGPTLAGTSAVPVVTETPGFAPPETIVYLHDVFWGEHPPAQIFDRRLETPSMTPEQTAWYMNAVQSGTPIPTAPFPEAVEVAALESLGPAPSPNVIELKGGPVPANLPASMFDAGVTGTATPQSLLHRGYGLSLGEAAAYWKAHKKPAPRVFTNRDLQRK